MFQHVDWAQAANAGAAFAAFVSSQLAYQYLTRDGTHRAFILHVVHSTLLLWYAVVNASLAIDVWTPEPTDVIPLFRWAFAPLLLSYTARQYMVSRRIKQLVKSVEL